MHETGSVPHPYSPRGCVEQAFWQELFPRLKATLQPNAQWYLREYTAQHINIPLGFSKTFSLIRGPNEKGRPQAALSLNNPVSQGRFDFESPSL